jgi:hypothetical protein
MMSDSPYRFSPQVSRLDPAAVDVLDPWDSWQKLSGGGPISTKTDEDGPGCWYFWATSK